MGTGPKKEFSALPEGDYVIRLIQTDEKKTSKGNNMVTARFQVVKGDYKDRLVFENYILDHDNEMVVEISLRKLRDLALATGDNTEYESISDIVANLGEYSEIPVMATLAVKEPFINSKGETKIDNRITKISAR